MRNKVVRVSNLQKRAKVLFIWGTELERITLLVSLFFHLFPCAKCFTFLTVGYDVEEGQDVSFVSIILIGVTEDTK